MPMRKFGVMELETVLSGGSVLSFGLTFATVNQRSSPTRLIDEALHLVSHAMFVTKRVSVLDPSFVRL